MNRFVLPAASGRKTQRGHETASLRTPLMAALTVFGRIGGQTAPTASPDVIAQRRESVLLLWMGGKLRCF